jgi:hypothetical protein
MKLEDVAPCMYVNKLACVLASTNMVQSNVVNEFTLLASHNIGKVHHVSKFDLASVAGYFNSFGARFRVDHFNKAVSYIDAKKHIISPDDMYDT